MRRILLLCLAGTFLSAPVLPAAAQQMPPHAWLFGTWTGGVFPPPQNMSREACLSQPVVIFTRDLVMRATLTEQELTQRVIESARATPTGMEFRFASNGMTAPDGILGKPYAAADGLRLRQRQRAARAAAGRERDQLPRLRRLPQPAGALPLKAMPAG